MDSFCWTQNLAYFTLLNFHGSENFSSFVWTLLLWPLNTYFLTLSWRKPLSYRNQSIDLQSKPRDWFLYDNGLRHERVKFTVPVLEIEGFPEILPKVISTNQISWNITKVDIDQSIWSSMISFKIKTTLNNELNKSLFIFQERKIKQISRGQTFADLPINLEILEN